MRSTIVKALLAPAMGLTLLGMASSANANCIVDYDFLGGDPVTVAGVTVEGVTVSVSTTVPSGHVAYSSTQGYGVIVTGVPGAALDAGQSLDFAFSDLGGPLTVRLTEVSFFLANKDESFTASLSADGTSWDYIFPAGTDPNVSNPVDVTLAALTGNSFRVLNTSAPGTNFRVSGMKVECVPDGGSTLLLLGTALSGLAFLRRRFA